MSHTVPARTGAKQALESTSNQGLCVAAAILQSGMHGIWY